MWHHHSSRLGIWKFWDSFGICTLVLRQSLYTVNRHISSHTWHHAKYLLQPVCVKLQALITEARVRLLSSLKRYFHNKRAEGLLSGKVRVSPHTRRPASEPRLLMASAPHVRHLST